MTSLDLLIVIVFVAAVIFGWMRGIIVQLSWVGGLIAAVLLCRIAGAPLAEMLAGADGPDAFDIVLAHVILFLIGYIVVKVICYFAKKVTRAVHLGLFDRIGGVAFCVLQWMLVLSLGLNFWLVLRPGYDFTKKSSFHEGRMETAVVKLAPAVLGWAFDDETAADTIESESNDVSSDTH